MDGELKMADTQSENKRRPLTLILLLLLSITSLAGGAWFWLDQQNTAPPPRASLAAEPGTMQAPRKAAREIKAKEVPKQGQLKSEQEVSIPQFGSLEAYAKLDAEEAYLEKEKKIATLRRDIKKILMEETAVGKPQKPQITQDDVRDLVGREVQRLYPDEKSKPEAAPSATGKASRFVSIQGTNGNLAAQILDSGGKITKLTTGGEYAGGKITRITRSGVTITKNGETVFYPF